MTVAELLRKCDSQELTEWMAYVRLENEDMEMATLQAKSSAGAQERVRRR